jgi:hypothetical protein
MKWAFLLMTLLLAGCASRSILPDSKEVKVSRDEPSKKCRNLGEITGTTLYSNGTREQALANMKQEAANKGANYVMVKEYSAYGTSVTGLAYECP